MLEKNAGIADLFSRMEDVSKRFVAQRETCDKNPQDDGLYVELLDLSAEKNRLQDQIDRELKMSFNLAKRLAAISIAQVNETISRARAKVEEGDIKGALEILDGASSALKRRRLLHKAADRAEAEELQIKELKASAEIEYFRVDALMAYTAMPFEERFKKAEGIYKVLLGDLKAFAEVCLAKNTVLIARLRMELLVHFADLYEEKDDAQTSIEYLNQAWELAPDDENEGLGQNKAEIQRRLSDLFLRLGKLRDARLCGAKARSISLGLLRRDRERYVEIYVECVESYADACAASCLSSAMMNKVKYALLWWVRRCVSVFMPYFADDVGKLYEGGIAEVAKIDVYGNLKIRLLQRLQMGLLRYRIGCGQFDVDSIDSFMRSMELGMSHADCSIWVWFDLVVGFDTKKVGQSLTAAIAIQRSSR